jgi:putative RNA 2'-phosphotransferase
MAKKSKSQASVSLSRLVNYALGRAPDEFGLAPDADGFVPIKEFLKALHEEEGLGFVRRSHLEEAARQDGEAAFELTDAAIRSTAMDRPIEYEAAEPPKLLYVGLRRRTWPVVFRNGLSPGGNRPWVVLAVDQDMALRLGRRQDPEPVLVTVRAAAAAEMGYVFRRVGEALWLTDYLPDDVLDGPPIKEADKTEAGRPKPKRKPPGPSLPEQPVGSVILDPEKMEREAKRRKGITKDIAWKKETRRQRRQGPKNRD